MEFLDRVDELARLKNFLADAAGGFVCLYGRRRVGKSRLLDEALADVPNVVAHIADRSDPVLQRIRLASDVSKLIIGFDRVSYPDWGALLDCWRREAPHGSVLVVDEFPYLVEQAPELPSVFQRILEKIGPTGLKIVLCGSSQRMMQGLVLDANEPLCGRAREILNLRPLGIEWMKQAFPRMSAADWLEHFGVWGGIPRYWELSVGEKSLWDTLRHHVFSTLGLLRAEPQYLLMDDLNDSVQASSVLTLIGLGSERLSEIAARLQIPATALTRPLRRLVNLGLVRKEMPFGANDKGNKRSLYKIADPFLAFWYRFVLPNFSDEHYLEDREELEALRSSYQIYLGGVWEGVVRDALGRKRLPGCSMRFRNAARWWGNGTDGRPMEIDVVAGSTDGRTLLVGEAKLKLSEVEAAHALFDLKAKAACLPFASGYAKVECRLFVADARNPGEIGMDWVMA